MRILADERLDLGGVGTILVELFGAFRKESAQVHGASSDLVNWAGNGEARRRKLKRFPTLWTLAPARRTHSRYGLGGTIPRRLSRSPSPAPQRRRSPARVLMSEGALFGHYYAGRGPFFPCRDGFFRPAGRGKKSPRAPKQRIGRTVGRDGC